MNYLTISDKYRVALEPNNHTLQQFVAGGKVISNDKLTKDRWVNMGHFPNLKQCLNRIVLEEVTGRDYANIGEYLDRLEALISQQLSNKVI